MFVIYILSYTIFLKGTKECNDINVMIGLKDEKTYKQTWQVLNSPSGLSCYSPYYQLVSHCLNFSQFRSATVQFSCAPTPVMVSLKCIVPTSVSVIAASQFAHKV